jgi:asparagine synthase (glutamine-hydrolysing)
MCGIAGFWNHRHDAPAADGVIRSMAATIAHRGPDEDGFFVAGSVALGMRRLSVVDPTGGHQPMANEDGSIRLVYNGEVYNHALLRDELTAKGHCFRTRSDTEVIVHAYEEWGTRCVERFNGMFAFALWDGARRRLVLARDRLGIKPLYFYEGPHGLVFGSELKAVIAAPWVPLEWDVAAVDDFLTYEYVPAPRSIVSGVLKLPAGTVRVYQATAGGVSAISRRFWRPHAGAEPPVDPLSAAEELKCRLSRSVKRRLMADVPLGAFLSGGIDSSVIVALMSNDAAAEVRSFSLGFADRSYNELPYSRIVARHFATKHREEVVTPEIGELASRLAAYFDEPFGDVSAFPTYMISVLARRDVTVALSGDGGDELFAGYDQYHAHRWAHRLRHIVGTRPWLFADRLLDGLPPTTQKKGVINRAKRFAEGVRRPADLEHARWWVFSDLIQRRELFTPELHDAVQDRDPFAFYRERLAEADAAGFRGLQRQLYADITGYLADDILTKVDRMSMAVSLETRVPFLDHEVVEYALAIPDAWKLRGSAGKWILKKAFAGVLPPAILQRGKQGFSMPMKNWLRDPLRPLLGDLLAESRVRDRGWFRPDEVRLLTDEHMRGQENHAHRLWCMMSLELSQRALSELAARRNAAARHFASLEQPA